MKDGPYMHACIDGVGELNHLALCIYSKILRLDLLRFVLGMTLTAVLSPDTLHSTCCSGEVIWLGSYLDSLATSPTIFCHDLGC